MLSMFAGSDLQSRIRSRAGLPRARSVRSVLETRTRPKFSVVRITFLISLGTQVRSKVALLREAFRGCQELVRNFSITATCGQIWTCDETRPIAWNSFFRSAIPQGVLTVPNETPSGPVTQPDWLGLTNFNSYGGMVEGRRTALYGDARRSFRLRYARSSPSRGTRSRPRSLSSLRWRGSGSYGGGYRDYPFVTVLYADSARRRHRRHALSRHPRFGRSTSYWTSYPFRLLGLLGSDVYGAAGLGGRDCGVGCSCWRLGFSTSRRTKSSSRSSTSAFSGASTSITRRWPGWCWHQFFSC